ncbi:Hypothetical predicted protein [Cloeon dipterum]|uniref:C2H2-type domain-containing protein n=1 Tax=Cloeon dipterum TaxID=197152 RepID=A0A8S1D8P7_9INSE|nr:Hypothetical predicted protein [Cloeon dipterum]
MRLRVRYARGADAPVQKPLCRLCECPTSDGFVLGSQVDRTKLRNWAMMGMNLTESDEYLPEEVEKDDFICYFCIWQAEFADESGDESVAWWPQNLDLDKTSEQLRENYSEGKVEQCWVQLDEVEEEIDLEPEETVELGPEGGKCVYCGKLFLFLRQHMRILHRNAMKCPNEQCNTYFHTLEERKRHFLEQHSLIPKKKLPMKCQFCEVTCLTSSYKIHVYSKHPEFSKKCAFIGCYVYFGSEAEAQAHFRSAHANTLKMKKRKSLFAQPAEKFMLLNPTADENQVQSPQ